MQDNPVKTANQTWQVKCASFVMEGGKMTETRYCYFKIILDLVN